MSASTGAGSFARTSRAASNRATMGVRNRTGTPSRVTVTGPSTPKSTGETAGTVAFLPHGPDGTPWPESESGGHPAKGCPPETTGRLRGVDREAGDLAAGAAGVGRDVQSHVPRGGGREVDRHGV